MARTKRSIDQDGDGDCASGPIDVTVHRWSREPWRGKLQTILSGLEIDSLDEGSQLYLQRRLYIANMFGKDGQGHVVLTLRCITESAGNENALCEMMVRAVSNAIGPYEDRGIELLEAFDQIPLIRIFEQMKALEYFYVSEASSALERILKHKLRRILFPPQPEPPNPPNKKERIAAEKQAIEAARRKIVEQKIDLGRKLAALRDATPNNRRFGRAVRERFNLHDPLQVAEMMRVARMYGARPEIYRAVGWRVLTELASSATSEEQRQEFEARILAGERVNGAEIIRARP